MLNKNFKEEEDQEFILRNPENTLKKGIFKDQEKNKLIRRIVDEKK